MKNQEISPHHHDYLILKTLAAETTVLLAASPMPDGFVFCRLSSFSMVSYTIYPEAFGLRCPSAHLMAHNAKCLQPVPCGVVFGMQHIHLPLSLRNQSSEAQVVHDIFHLPHFVLYAVTTSSQRVILEVEDLEASMKVFDELADHQRSLIIAQRHRVARKTSLFSQQSA